MSIPEEIVEEFKHLLEEVKFNLIDHIFLSKEEDLTKFQKQNIQKAVSILEKNIVGEVKYFGGNTDKNADQFNEFVEKLNQTVNSDQYEPHNEELRKLIKTYVKTLKELIEKTCYAIIPVKEMPWKDILFRTVPRISIEEGTIQLFDDLISFYGEIDTLISKTTIYGKIKNEKPLFAPVMGEIELDIDITRENIERSTKKIYNFTYINALIKALETKSTQNHLMRYHEGYQRHGEPICDFLMNQNDLMTSMNNLLSGIESGRLSSKAVVCAIAYPEKENNRTIVLTLDEREASDKFEKCFESVLRLSAACYEVPKADMISSTPMGAQQPAARQGQTMQTPAGQEMKVWTAEELAQQAKEREAAGLPDGVEAWSEEDLQQLAQQRNRGIPEGMEVWSEEELQELAKKRQGGGLDIPEWKPDEDMLECPNCGYTLRSDWSECPICNTPVGDVNSQHPPISPDSESETRIEPETDPEAETESKDVPMEPEPSKSEEESDQKD
ncbi:MAG: hypothetical protein BAJALOKI1v1_380001 [Promethearchaeota archaeon]|nr:MAG: hypothetical protein BAJALOKI1v1_380001 [Candidatus Lokiarchaeota archaeon]